MSHPRFPSPIHGWIVLDKPLGQTSTQALGRVRRLLGGTKAGHGGTLDPLASGILPLAFGEATKLIPLIMDGSKEYEFTVKWGESRTTDDGEGSVVAKTDARPKEDQIRAALPTFTGTIMQTPPAFSALKVDGARAYDLARAGETVVLAPREVTIFSLEMAGPCDIKSASFKVHCGKGTYIRALARDLAKHLGTLGYVSVLRRTKVGPFTLDQAHTLKALENLGKTKTIDQALLPLKTALGQAPTLVLSDTEAQALRVGKTILIRPEHGDVFASPSLFAEHKGVPIATIEAKNGQFRVLRGFHF